MLQKDNEEHEKHTALLREKCQDNKEIYEQRVRSCEEKVKAIKKQIQKEKIQPRTAIAEAPSIVREERKATDSRNRNLEEELLQTQKKLEEVKMEHQLKKNLEKSKVVEEYENFLTRAQTKGFDFGMGDYKDFLREEDGNLDQFLLKNFIEAAQEKGFNDFGQAQFAEYQTFIQEAQAKDLNLGIDNFFDFQRFKNEET